MPDWNPIMLKFSASSNNQVYEVLIMQKITTAILAITLAAITVSFIAANGMLPTTFMIAQSNQLPGINEKTGMLGHVTYVVRGPDGNIKSYAQTDNDRTVQGINCAEQVLFAPTGQVLNTNGSAICLGLTPRGTAGFNGFNVIGLVNGSSTAAMIKNGSDTVALSRIGGARASVAGGLEITGSTNQGGPLLGTVAGATGCAGNPAPGCYNQITITSPAYSFTSLKAAGTNIRGSMLLNTTSINGAGTNANVFAENTFSGGGVAVGSGDTLTVTWTITLA